MLPFSEFMLFLRSIILSDLSESSFMELKHKALDLYSGSEQMSDYGVFMGGRRYPMAAEEFRLINDILWQHQASPAQLSKILVIKYIRDKYKVGLKEAKDAVDLWAKSAHCPPEEYARRADLGQHF
jgi:ribosomal protein L7/L12